MDANTKFEIEARMFQLMTGHLAPGKSLPMDSCCEQADTERRAAWRVWEADHNKILSAMHKAIDDVLD